MTSEIKTNTSSQNTKYYSNEHVESTIFPNSQSTTISHHRSTKWLIALLVIFVFLLVGSVFAFVYRSAHVNSVPDVVVSPTTFKPSPTTVADNKAMWQTYRNEEYGFEFKYPSDWQVRTEDNSDFTNIYLDSNIQSHYNDSPIPTPKYVSYSIEISRLAKNDSRLTTVPIDATNIVVSGRSAYQTTELPDGMFTVLNTLIDFSDDSYLKFGVYPYEIEQEIPLPVQVQEVYDQILSTFRFIDPVDSNSIALDSKEKCLQDGGVWQSWGLFPGEYCQIPSADGGKSCTDGSQCNLNSCITYSDSSAGQCRTYQDTFGCYSELVDSTMSPGLCFD